MFFWFSHKKYPEFWKHYLKQFRKKQSKTIEEIKFIIFDTETTGLNIQEDRILSIGAISVRNNIIFVEDSFEVFVKQETYTKNTVEIHGILKEGIIDKTSEEKAMELFLNYIENAVLVAHHAAFDIEMINMALKRMQLPKLKNKFIDTGILYKKLEGKKDSLFSLDFLCDEFSVSKHDRHTAAGDAFITAKLFLKILKELKKQRTIHYSDLFRKPNKKGLL